MNDRISTKWVLLLAGIVIGALSAAWVLSSFGSTRPVAPYIVEGYAGSNFAGTAIAVSKEIDGPGEGYVIGGAHWREFGGPWHDYGTPPSLAQPNSNVKVRLGVVNVKPTDQAPGYAVVAWIEVLG